MPPGSGSPLSVFHLIVSKGVCWASAQVCTLPSALLVITEDENVEDDDDGD